MMKMMDTRKRLWMMVTLLTTLIAGAQQQGIVRTLERPGKASEALSGVTIDVLEYPNAIVSKKGGQFSFAIPGKRQGDSYTVSRVQNILPIGALVVDAVHQVADKENTQTAYGTIVHREGGVGLAHTSWVKLST